MRFFRTGTLGFTTLAVSFIKNKNETKNKYAYSDNLKFPTKLSVFTYNANSPSEDRYAIRENDGWNIVGVFDGHGGWQVAEFVEKTLVAQISESLVLVSVSDVNSIEKLITNAFTAVEKAYIEKIRPAYDLGFGSVASVGSCVIVAAQKDSTLIVGNCGDCRAVIGSKSNLTSESKFISTRVTNDHNARIALEEEKLRKEHPDEDNIIVCKNPHACYVKGRLQLTRALGDLYLKSTEFNAPKDSHRSRGRHIPPPYTPPYVGSAPDIFHVHLTTHDKFIILASDGLWDFLSDEQAVEIVSNCTDPKRAAEALVNNALDVAAKNCDLNLEELMNLPAGSQRRSRHDDTTVIVMYF